MRIVHTDQVQPTDLKNQWERDQVYNGLDCCITLEVLNVLLPRLDVHTQATYDFSRSLQGPALEMRLRGVLVDQQRKNEVIDEYFEQIELLERNLERIVLEGVGLQYFNWRSNADLQRLFYEKLGIPVIKKGGRPTCDRGALEKMEAYLIARPLVRHITAMRDIGKKISVLKTEIDPDHRMRTSYNIAGTSTFRFSSSFSEFGTGGNLQNVEEMLRSIFIADPKMKFAKFDAKQIQSRIVGAIIWNLFKDGTYLDACEDSDLHTVVAKMVWPNLAWTGDPAKDYKVAETPYYRHYTYRFMCKKLGHGSNFEGRPPTLAAQAKVPLQLIQEFQPKYYRAFPGIPKYHEWVRDTIAKTGMIIGITGRKRQFWGRRNDDSTIREAIAYDPQASEAFIVNSGMLNIWRARDAIMMMQDHDAVTVMYPEEQEDEVIPKIKEQLKVPIRLMHDRVLEIPYDCKVGWNRGDWSEKNQDGLKDYKDHDTRKRSAKLGILDRKG
jgi:DNA polymerase I-like protein with 3'-5' exonuclease and polymerase domains